MHQLTEPYLVPGSSSACVAIHLSWMRTRTEAAKAPDSEKDRARWQQLAKLLLEWLPRHQCPRKQQLAMQGWRGCLRRRLPPLPQEDVRCYPHQGDRLSRPHSSGPLP